MKKEIEKIVNARKEKGMTQATLADKMKVSRLIISKWERGILYPNHEELKKLKEILGLEEKKETKEKHKEKEENKVVEASNISKDEQLSVMLSIVGFALSVSLVVLNLLGGIKMEESINLLSIAVLCISASKLLKR